METYKDPVALHQLGQSTQISVRTKVVAPLRNEQFAVIVNTNAELGGK